MNSTLVQAVIVVNFALVFYSIAVVTEQKKSLVTRYVLLFLTLGISCDIASTALMILGSRNIPITVHGFLGYTALLVMLIDTILIWRYWARNRSADKVTRGLHIYTRIAYSWWIIAYIAGAVIALGLRS